MNLNSAAKFPCGTVSSHFYIFLVLSLSFCFQISNITINFLLAQRINKCQCQSKKYKACCRYDAGDIVDVVYNFRIISRMLCYCICISNHGKESAGKSGGSCLSQLSCKGVYGIYRSVLSLPCTNFSVVDNVCNHSPACNVKECDS